MIPRGSSVAYNNSSLFLGKKNIYIFLNYWVGWWEGERGEGGSEERGGFPLRHEKNCISLHKMCATLNLFDLSEGHPGV